MIEEADYEAAELPAETVRVNDNVFFGTVLIGNATPSVAGGYWLIIKDPNRTVISSHATITVLSTVAPPAGDLVGNGLQARQIWRIRRAVSPAGTRSGYGITGAGLPASN